jgi:ADP-heptose:LPS heptosyltransferase
MAPDQAPRSILAIRTGPIGNTLAAVPALRALRGRYPDARLALLVSPIAHPLLARCPWLDEVLVYDARGAQRPPLGYARLVARLRRLRPTHAVVFKRFLRAGLLARLSGAPERVGFRTAGRAPWLTRAIEYDPAAPVVDLNLTLVGALDAPPAGRHLEVFPGDADVEEAARAMRARGVVPGGFWVAHYGGTTTPPGFVPAVRFAALLASLTGGAPVLLAGAGERERGWATDVTGCLASARSCVGLSLGGLAALLRQARGFVGFSSGPAHVAAAAGIPTWVVFEPGGRVADEIHKWLPPADAAHALVPPTAGDDRAWDAFCASARAAAVGPRE